MPNPTKKVMVKVPKKTAETKVEMEAYVPKGLSKEFIAKVNETTDYNKKRNEVESMAKSDSIVGAKKAKFEGKDLVDQRRAGNKAANETRVKDKVPQVMRGREISHSSYPAGDKYTNPMNVDASGTSDIYTRTNPLEKDMPKVPKVMVKVKKK
jgi:hypothetical protein